MDKVYQALTIPAQQQETTQDTMQLVEYSRVVKPMGVVTVSKIQETV